MTKAFDLQDLIARLKKHGIEIADEVAKDVVNDVFDWTSESIPLSGNAFAMMIVPFLPQVKTAVLNEVDKELGVPASV